MIYDARLDSTDDNLATDRRYFTAAFWSSSLLLIPNRALPQGAFLCPLIGLPQN